MEYMLIIIQNSTTENYAYKVANSVEAVLRV